MDYIIASSRIMSGLRIFILNTLMSGVLLGACVPTPTTSSAEEKPAEIAPVVELQSTVTPQPTNTPLPPSSTPTIPPPTLREIADDIAADYGVVIDVIDGDPERVIYIFEERHYSILGQIEIASMLNRLYSEYGMRHIGLEGLMTSEGLLDLSWAHVGELHQPEQPITNREDVLVQMTLEGTLNGIELVGLIYADVQVHGIDNTDLYNIALKDKRSWFAPYDYNYQTAVYMLDETGLATWRQMMQDGDAEKAYQFAIQSSGYAQEILKRISASKSAEDFIGILDELAQKSMQEAQRLGVNLHPGLIDNMAELRDYMDVVTARSEGMANEMIKLSSTHPETPLAMTTGEMHSDRVVEILADAGVSVVWLQPLSLKERSQSGQYSRGAYTRLVIGNSPAPEGTLGAILEGRRKPAPQGDKENITLEQAFREALQEMDGDLSYFYDWSAPIPEPIFGVPEEYEESSPWEIVNVEMMFIQALRKYNIPAESVNLASIQIMHPGNSVLDHVELGIDGIKVELTNHKIIELSGTLIFNPEDHMIKASQRSFDDLLDNAIEGLRRNNINLEPPQEVNQNNTEFLADNLEEDCEIFCPDPYSFLENLSTETIKNEIFDTSGDSHRGMPQNICSTTQFIWNNGEE